MLHIFIINTVVNVDDINIPQVPLIKWLSTLLTQLLLGITTMSLHVFL